MLIQAALSIVHILTLSLSASPIFACSSMLPAIQVYRTSDMMNLEEFSSCVAHTGSSSKIRMSLLTQ